ncbi:hypothetical protein ACQPXM_25085 [Kribbella sp. CA-253562]|uniref:hypothetical protein n=1 Tax=Kribbella sp. CA-253562 TaxID=3239942 RepID=UPI003D92E42C
MHDNDRSQRSTSRRTDWWPPPIKPMPMRSPKYLLGVALIPLLFTTVGAISSFLTWSRSDWGSVWGAVGQWMGAIGTLAAVIVALWIARTEARAAVREARERGIRELEAEKRVAVERASLVIAEVTQVPLSIRQPSDPQWVVQIVNYGPTPVVLPRLEGFAPVWMTRLAYWKFENPTDPNWEIDHDPPAALGTGERITLPVSISYKPALTKGLG